MLCIFCCQERPPSCEHVLPLAIGGTIAIDRVCEECNSALGSRVDAALSDFFPIRVRRAKLGLAGNKGESPAWYEMFLGQAKLVGETADRVQITFNEATGRLDSRSWQSPWWRQISATVGERLTSKPSGSQNFAG